MKHTLTIPVVALTLSVSLLACIASEEPKWDEKAQTSTVALMDMTSAIAAVAGPLAAMEDTKQQTNADGTDETTLENNVGTWVTDPNCVTVTWVLASLSADFDNCILSTTGQRLDGKVTAGLALFPTRVYLDFEQVSFDEHALDGALSLQLTRDEAGVTARLDVDLSYANSAAAVSLDQLALQNDPATGSVTLTGSGNVITATSNASATLNDVTWTGACHPSSGSVVIDLGQGPINVGFTAETPNTGMVQVQLGALPPFSYQAFLPCS